MQYEQKLLQPYMMLTQALRPLERATGRGLLQCCPPSSCVINTRLPVVSTCKKKTGKLPQMVGGKYAVDVVIVGFNPADYMLLDPSYSRTGKSF